MNSSGFSANQPTDSYHTSTNDSLITCSTACEQYKDKALLAANQPPMQYLTH